MVHKIRQMSDFAIEPHTIYCQVGNGHNGIMHDLTRILNCIEFSQSSFHFLSYANDFRLSFAFKQIHG